MLRMTSEKKLPFSCKKQPATLRGYWLTFDAKASPLLCHKNYFFLSVKNVCTSVCSLPSLFMLSLSILTEYRKDFIEVKEKFTVKLIAAPAEAEGISTQLPTLPKCSH